MVLVVFVDSVVVSVLVVVFGPNLGVVAKGLERVGNGDLRGVTPHSLFKSDRADVTSSQCFVRSFFDYKKKLEIKN